MRDRAEPETSDFPGWNAAFESALARLRIASRRRASSPYPGTVRSSARGRAIEFADYRPYVSGDEPRLIDWRSYARHGRLYVKRHDEERERTLTLLVDASASLDFGEGAAHKGAYGRRLAAALAWISLARHEPVRAWALRDGRAERLASALGTADAASLFRALASTRESGGTALADGVAAALVPRLRGPVVLISDLLDAGWREAIRQLAPYESAIIQPLAPEEWEPALDEEVELEDVESGGSLPARLGPKEVGAYQERLRTFLGDVAAETRRLGVLHTALRTDTPLRDAVLQRLTAAGVLTA